MAVMHPAHLGEMEKPTAGETKVFHFLKEAARPHQDYLCWYRPLLGTAGLEPDFVLFGKSLGLLVLEVKDWVLNQILGADPIQFRLRKRGEESVEPNPDRQAKGYVNILLGKLRSVPGASSALSVAGRVKVPIGRMVVFPNIGRHEYLLSGLQEIIPSERVMFREDLDYAGGIACNGSGHKFRERLLAAMPPRPFAGLPFGDLAKLAALIWPEIQICLPNRAGISMAQFRREVMVLDEQQARVARHLKRGHRLIKGPPGSGKTLVLVHRCCLLRKYDAKVQRVLFVCYNIALVSYLKRLLQEAGLGIGPEGIEVCHFYELCSWILKEPVKYDDPDSAYYDLVVQCALGEARNGTSFPKFDAVFVDEGQDFSSDMLRLMVEVLRPGGDLVIALDSYQDLYRRRDSWHSLGIEIRGRSLYLPKVYRSTAEIFKFSQQVIGIQGKQTRNPALFSEEIGFSGPLPELRRCRNLEDLINFLIDDVGKNIAQGEYAKSEIAIIYDDKQYTSEGFGYDARDLPRMILAKMEGAGIPTKWVSQDVRSKEMFDITTDRVSLVSIHSAKGLEFDLVYLVGLDRISPSPETTDILLRLLYVAITRAKHRLVTPYFQEGDLITRMLRCQGIESRT